MNPDFTKLSYGFHEFAKPTAEARQAINDSIPPWLSPEGIEHRVVYGPQTQAQLGGIPATTPSPTPYVCGNCGAKRKWMIAGTVLGFSGGIALFLYCLKRTAGGKSVVVGI